MLCHGDPHAAEVRLFGGEGRNSVCALKKRTGRAGVPEFVLSAPRVRNRHMSRVRRVIRHPSLLFRALLILMALGFPSVAHADDSSNFGINILYSSCCVSYGIDGSRASIETPAPPFFTTPAHTGALMRVAAEGTNGVATPKLIQAGFFEGANVPLDGTCGPAPVYFVERAFSSTYYVCTGQGSASSNITHQFSVREIGSNTWRSYIDGTWTGDEISYFSHTSAIYAGGEITALPGTDFTNSQGTVWGRYDYDSGCCSSALAWQRLVFDSTPAWSTILGSDKCNGRATCPNSGGGQWTIGDVPGVFTIHH
jgi:hypothetical protein